MDSNNIDNIIIRRLQDKEALVYKSIRLESLLDSPKAFSTRYQDAIERSNDSWEKQPYDLAMTTDSSAFIAFDNQKPIGLCGFYRSKENTNNGELVQVWVNNKYRNKGIAKSLIDKTIEWAAENCISNVLAKVYVENIQAIGLYEKMGFNKGKILGNEYLMYKEI